MAPLFASLATAEVLRILTDVAEMKATICHVPLFAADAAPVTRRKRPTEEVDIPVSPVTVISGPEIVVNAAADPVCPATVF
jgi:hypothetical protein